MSNVNDVAFCQMPHHAGPRSLPDILSGLPHLLALLLLLFPALLAAQERPYFVTYSHDLEEPGNLESATKSISGAPAGAHSFLSNTLELEYGATGWWTTEFYLSGQTTQHESTIFNGFRWENRFRLLMREHAINPVLYVEFEDINAADKALLEVVGHDSIANLRESNAVVRQEKLREAELKLILSRNWRGWNFAQNTIFEKNLAGDPWEFGYAMAASRPLASAARSVRCTLCRENFAVGTEMYGGLGDHQSAGLHHTSHYLSPTVAWSSPNGPTFTLGPAFGLNKRSAGALVRFGVSYEVAQVFSRFRSVHNIQQDGSAR